MAKFCNSETGIMEPWIETASGKKFSFVDVNDTDSIDIHDIAHALSNIPRFTGHCSRFYSVAEHSVYVARLIQDKNKKLWGLLHDASEAYMGDMSSPLKSLNPSYKLLEETVSHRIARKFKLPVYFWNDPEVKRADISQLKTESEFLLPSRGSWFYFNGDLDTGFTPKCLSPDKAKDLFLDYAYRIAAEL